MKRYKFKYIGAEQRFIATYGDEVYSDTAPNIVVAMSRAWSWYLQVKQGERQ